MKKMDIAVSFNRAFWGINILDFFSLLKANPPDATPTPAAPQPAAAP